MVWRKEEKKTITTGNAWLFDIFVISKVCRVSDFELRVLFDILSCIFVLLNPYLSRDGCLGWNCFCLQFDYVSDFKNCSHDCL